MIHVNLIAEASPPQPRAAGRSAQGAEGAGAAPRLYSEPRRIAGMLQAAAMVIFLVAALGWLAFDYLRVKNELDRVQQQIALQQAQLARLNRLRAEVATFEQQKAAIDRRIQLISQLQANRQESQQLLEFIAQTVNGSPSLWLTNVTRKGDALSIEGRAASIDAVARFIGELKRSGHFGDIQMKTTEQQPNHEVTTFEFTLDADYLAAPATAPASARTGNLR